MRLFIGLPLPPCAADDTARLAQAAAQQIPGRYTLESNYHLTLAFLGEVSEAQLDRAKQVLHAVAARFPAPRVRLTGLSSFAKHTNAILIRSAESPDGLEQIRLALHSALGAAALPYTDGPFAPHVTLARHADITGVSLDALRAGPVSFAAPEMVLFLSARDEENILRYTPLSKAPFLA